MKIKLTLPNNIIREYPAERRCWKSAETLLLTIKARSWKVFSMALALICKSLFLKMVQLIL